MNQLKKDIKHLETKMALETMQIEIDQELLNQNKYAGRVLGYAAAGCFAIGFLFTRKKTLLQSLKRLIKISIVTKRLYQSAKHFLPFI